MFVLAYAGLEEWIGARTIAVLEFQLADAGEPGGANVDESGETSADEAAESDADGEA